MYWDVTAVKPKPGYKIYVELKDGRKGVFDMSLILGTEFLKNLGMRIK